MYNFRKNLKAKLNSKKLKSIFLLKICFHHKKIIIKTANKLFVKLRKMISYSFVIIKS